MYSLIALNLIASAVSGIAPDAGDGEGIVDAARSGERATTDRILEPVAGLIADIGSISY